MLRSSQPDVFCKKGVLRNFANKVAGRPATLLKRDSGKVVFLWVFWNF